MSNATLTEEYVKDDEGCGSGWILVELKVALPGRHLYCEVQHSCVYHHNASSDSAQVPAV